MRGSRYKDQNGNMISKEEFDAIKQAGDQPQPNQIPNGKPEPTPEDTGADQSINAED